MKRRNFSPEFKRESAQLVVDQNYTVSDAAKAMDVGLSTTERQRLKALERENRELRRSNDILRQASAYFAKAEFVYGRLLFCQVIVAILMPTVKIAVLYSGSLCVSLSYAAHNGICLLAPKRPLRLERKVPDYRTPRDVPAPV
jgi:transposase-like protein